MGPSGSRWTRRSASAPKARGPSREDARALQRPVRHSGRVRIRGDLALDIGRNIVHGSDSVESATRELAIYFNKDELVDWTPVSAKWVIE